LDFFPIPLCVIFRSEHSPCSRPPTPMDRSNGQPYNLTTRVISSAPSSAACSTSFADLEMPLFILRFLLRADEISFCCESFDFFSSPVDVTLFVLIALLTRSPQRVRPFFMNSRKRLFFTTTMPFLSSRASLSLFAGARFIASAVLALCAFPTTTTLLSPAYCAQSLLSRFFFNLLVRSRTDLSKSWFPLPP